MRVTIKARVALAVLAAAGVTAAATNSYALDCNDPSLKSPVYVYGSSAVKPLIAALGSSLFSQNITVIYVDKGGSCDGVNAIVKGNLVSGVGLYYPGGTDDAGAPIVANCDIPVPDAGVGGLPVDIGVSDVWPESCPNVTVDYNTVGEFHGPNQVMTFVVPQKAAAMVKNISGEAAYFVMGQPDNGKTIAPWTDKNKLQIRSASSGTQTMLGKAIHLDATLWHGTNAGSSGGVVTAIQTANDTDPSPQNWLGIVSTGEADVNRKSMTVLGYQEIGKKCAFWPDSSLTSFDKINVRKGDYAVFGPLHILTKVASMGGDPTNATVQKIVHYFLGTEDPPGGKTQLLDLEIDNHTVPQCAMQVQRTTEMGPLTAFKPDKPCGCYFEKRLGTTTCATCQSDSDCGDAGNKICSYGYCEAK
jgi:ABC-type phosphate transport system substrate-binding protein